MKCKKINFDRNYFMEEFKKFSFIQIMFENAFLFLNSKSHPYELYPSKFTTSEDAIDINGLIWMGSEAFMKEQIAEKLEEGFYCIKMKIGAIDYNTEIKMIEAIRKEYSAKEKDFSNVESG